MLCAATFSNSFVKWHLRYVMLRFVAVPSNYLLRGGGGGYDVNSPRVCKVGPVGEYELWDDGLVWRRRGARRPDLRGEWQPEHQVQKVARGASALSCLRQLLQNCDNKCDKEQLKNRKMWFFSLVRYTFSNGKSAVLTFAKTDKSPLCFELKPT